ncbi:MAG: hypothetical protein ACHBN1_07690 [Heteroscytonema crispum UTEX LB 1556]
MRQGNKGTRTTGVDDGCGKGEMPKGRQMPGSGNPTAALAQQCPI